MNKAKRVSFGLQQTAYFAAPTVVLPEPVSPTASWYSDRELQQSRDEARQCILSLQQRLDQEGDQQTSISIDELQIPCPHDPSETICLRGIEKYADAAAKFVGQKRHVGSVLQQQALNKHEEHVAFVSRTLSQPFKDVARYYAIKSAEEQEELRRQEAEQRDVAHAIASMLCSSPHEKMTMQVRVVSSSSLVQDGRYTPPEMVSTSKRSLDDDVDHCLSSDDHCRNVKPCIRIISE